MRSKLIPVIVIGGLFVLILGWDKSYSYLATGKRMAQKTVSEALPFGFEIERAESMAEDLEGAILGYQERLVAVRVDADYLRDEIKLREKELEKDRVLLARISKLLEERQDSYLINGKRYSYDRVSEDAQTRGRVYESELDRLEAKKNNLKVLVETARLLEDQVRLAQSKQQEFGSAISKLKAKDAHLEAKKELAALSGGAIMKGFEKNQFVKIDGLLRELEKRQVKAERMLDGALGLRGQSSLIDYGP